MKKIISTVILWLAATALASAQPFSFRGTGLGSGGSPRGIAVADFDGDGRLDFAAANFGSAPHDVSVWYGTQAANGGWERPQFLEVGAGPFSIAAADFNHDNHPDLAVTVADADKIAILRWTPDGFVAHTSLIFQPPANPREILWGDFNRDGNPDLAYTLYEAGLVSVSYGQGGVNDFGSSAEIAVGRGAHGLAAAELNGDGMLDLVATNALTNRAVVIYNAGSGSFTPETYPVGSSPRNVTIADFNHDRHPDFAVVNTGSNSVTAYFTQDPDVAPDGRLFGHRRDLSAGSSPRDVEAVDANGDGWNDVAVTSFANDRVFVVDGFEIAGVAGAQARAAIDSFTGPRTMAIGDFNIDGRPDVLVGNQKNGAVLLFLNTTAFAGR